MTYELIVKEINLEHNHPPDPLLCIEYGGDLDKLDGSLGGIDYEEKLKEAKQKLK